MIRDKMIDEMQEPRLSGLSLEEAYDRLREKHRKAPHIKTVRKHHDMEAAPKDNHAKAGRRMAFDAEPLRGAVIEIMAKNPGCKMGPACDVLAERLVDEGDCDRLPGNGQTLRHLVHRLEDEGAMPQGADARRRHDSPGAPPAGERARMDFGEQRCEEGLVSPPHEHPAVALAPPVGLRPGPQARLRGGLPRDPPLHLQGGRAAQDAGHCVQQATRTMIPPSADHVPSPTDQLCTVRRPPAHRANR